MANVELTADRLTVTQGKRLRAVLYVSPARVLIEGAGGLQALAHLFEDVGFHDVRVYGAASELPADWTRGRDLHPDSGSLEWTLWVEGVPGESASLQRELSPELRVADAWDAAPPESAHGPATDWTAVALGVAVATVSAGIVAYALRDLRA